MGFNKSSNYFEVFELFSQLAFSMFSSLKLSEMKIGNFPLFRANFQRKIDLCILTSVTL